MSPLDMLEHGIARAGGLQILNHPDLAYDFLPVHWTSIQHYGIEIKTLRYNGPALNDYRKRTSPYGGAHAGKWPFAIDPGDITRVYFQDPRDHRWHTLAWEHTAELGRPLSAEALEYARRLAVSTQRFPDTKRALVELLERWGAGLTANPTERRMAVRLSAERLRLVETDETSAGDAVSALPSVARIAALSGGRSPGDDGEAVDLPAERADEDLGGDDDEDLECAAEFPSDADEVLSDEDFYADVLESS